MSLIKYQSIACTEATEESEADNTQSAAETESETEQSADYEELSRSKTIHDEDTTSESYVSAGSSIRSTDFWKWKPEGPHRPYSAISKVSTSSFGRPRYGPYEPEFYNYYPIELEDFRDPSPPPLLRHPDNREPGTSSLKRLDTDNDTLSSRHIESAREIANFPSRDDDRELRSIRRRAKIPLAVKPWCVRDVAWLDSKLRQQNLDWQQPQRGEINYMPFPHLSNAEGMLTKSLGIIEDRPADPHWQGPTPFQYRELDTWFLAGAQHFLRSQSSAAPEFFLRYPEIEAFEKCVKAVLEGLTYERYARKGSNLLKRVFDMCHSSLLGVRPPLEAVEALQDALQPAQRHYLRICLIICFNLKRLRFWRWREYNREYQRLLVGTMVLSKVVHEVLEEVGRLEGDTVLEGLELLQQVPEPIIPVYQRSKISREELVKAAKKRFELYPQTWGSAIAYSARMAFIKHGRDFEKWSDEQIKAYAAPDDDLWRTIDLRHIQPSWVEYNESDDIPWYHRSMDIKLRVQARWMVRMKSMTNMEKEFRSNIGDYFVFPDLKRHALQHVWRQITVTDNLYVYKVARPLRRSKSLPNLMYNKSLRRRLYDDQDTSNLGFDLDQLPARQPPRTHNGMPPAYPNPRDHSLCHLKDGLVSHSFIVIGWFPGEQLEPVEACMWYTDPEKFLAKLRSQINSLRGWRRFLSLKTVQAFGIYKCCLNDRSHQILDSKAHEDAFLAQFHAACFQKRLNRDRSESVEWAQWATTELNNWQGDNTFYFPMPIESHLSLRLITRWSRYRLILASTIPMMLSLAVGFYYMAVSGDVQTAWTVSGYIVTAGAFLIAVLAVLTNVQDGGVDTGKGKKRGPDPGLGA